MERLLAKSYDRSFYGTMPPDYALLTQHSRDVAEASDALAEVVGRIALHNAGLDVDFERFKLTLKANGWVQDIGKANSHFQKMVSTEEQRNQLLRHEVISAILILAHPGLKSWFQLLPDDIMTLAVWGALGHHRKFDEYTKPDRLAAKLTVFTSHKDFRCILQEIGASLGLGEPPQTDKDFEIAPTRNEGTFSATRALIDIQESFQSLERKFNSCEQRRTIAVVKALGINADVAASAIAAKGKSADRYSLASFAEASLSIGLSAKEIEQLVWRRAWSACGIRPIPEQPESLPPGFDFREFQVDVAASQSPITLARAGCGSGKSLAAYLWAARWRDTLEAAGRRNFRLIFCLPTTGTTTEHFKDYALESGVPSSLVHSRASIDLDAIAKTAAQEDAPDEASAAQAASAAIAAEQDKIESLALWSTPLVVTTTDTVLGLMANARRAIYSFPAIMSSAIVFDEVHAYDDRLFGHLLVFLKNFPKLPVLLMTASLPEARLEALQSIRPDLNVVPGPPDYELIPRYEFQNVSEQGGVNRAVSDCVQAGGKVLWVRNQVGWANLTYRDCKSQFPSATVDVYHSRLRYKDRAERHRNVIDRFNEPGKGCILVGTQVVEMSLDISADLLITDLAPIPALIQRLGRLNRRAKPGNATAKPAIVLTQDALARLNPYEKCELTVAQTWLDDLEKRSRALSQADLAAAFEKHETRQSFDITRAEQEACFFSGLWRTRPGLTRAEGYTFSVILEQDIRAWESANPNRQPSKDWIKNHEVSIPLKDRALSWPRVGYARRAPADEVYYDFDERTKEGTGARWLKK